MGKLKGLIKSPDFVNDKMGGLDVIVQVDETMLNYKCKSHRGRSPDNRTDALCIVEVKNGITRAFACTIPNKKAETLIPIILRQVAASSTIWSDEHKSYASLYKYFENVGTVCHKYRFINGDGVNTQAVESFNNCLKLAIKSRKGIITVKRDDFLVEFCFLFNNRGRLFEAVFDLIKI